MSKWMPIDNVPKKNADPIIGTDGDKILFARDDYEKDLIKKQHVMLYTPDILLYKKHHECNDCCYSDTLITMGSVIGSRVRYIVINAGDFWDHPAPLSCFSHWMPLPKAPVDGDE